MTNLTDASTPEVSLPSPENSSRAPIQAATTTSIVLAFGCVYFFWGSTFTAIRIGAALMPALLLAGVRFFIAGVILLAWCRWRGLRILWPARPMFATALIGVLLLAGGNVGLIFGEKTLPSGFSSLVMAGIPLYVVLIEMLLPKGETLPARGWWGIGLGFAGLVVLVWPSLRTGFAHDRGLLIALMALLGAGFSWAIGSVYSRRIRLPLNSFVAASWQMLIAGLFCTLLGTALGQWPQFHVTAASIGSLAYLVTGGSLLGYSGFVYLIEHMPVAKVSSYAYVNPVIAVLLGILVLHERPQPVEYIGMVVILCAVFLMTTARVKNTFSDPAQ